MSLNSVEEMLIPGLSVLFFSFLLIPVSKIWILGLSLTVGNVQEKTVIMCRAALYCRVGMYFPQMLKILYACFSQSPAQKTECQRKRSLMHTVAKEWSAVCAENICWATSCYLNVWFIFRHFPVSPDLPSLLLTLAERFNKSVSSRVPK